KNFQDIEKVAKRIRENLLPPLKKAFHESIIVDPDSATKCGTDSDICLRRLAVVNLHLYMCDLKQMGICFYQTFLRNKGRLRRNIPAEFYPGYKYALGYLFDSLGEPNLTRNSLQSLIKSKGWNGFERHYRVIERELVTPVENEHGIRAFIFTKLRDVSEPTRLKLLETDVPIRQPNL